MKEGQSVDDVKDLFSSMNKKIDIKSVRFISNKSLYEYHGFQLKKGMLIHMQNSVHT